MKKYIQIDISGDAGLRIYGESMQELFANAAEGMFNLITDVSAVQKTEEKTVHLISDNIENLLIQWLNELVFLFDTYGFVGKVFFVQLRDSTLEATVSGGYFDPEVNESRLLIKAATYHDFSLVKGNSHWEALVVFDI